MKKEEFRSKRLLAWVSQVAIILCCASGTAHAKNVDEKVRDFIDQSAEALKHGIDKLGDDLGKIQDYLENYSWKGMIQDTATSGAETLSHLRLKGRGKVIVVRPGETVSGEVTCSLNPDEAHSFNVYRVVIGLHGEGPQTTIGTTLGVAGGSSEERFSLTAPMEPGTYQIRFRTATNFLESAVLNAWIDEKGHEPDASTTIGIIYVKP